MLTMFYFCVRTPLSGFWCASISRCLDFESKSKCFPAIFYTAVVNINVRHFRDINIFCSSGDVKIGPSKPIKLLIAKLPPIWSLVKAQSYERTPVPQATACFWVCFVVSVIVIVIVIMVRNRTFYVVIRTRRSIDKWLTVSFFKFFGLQQFGVLQAIPSYDNKKNQIKFNGCY